MYLPTLRLPRAAGLTGYDFQPTVTQNIFGVLDDGASQLDVKRCLLAAPLDRSDQKNGFITVNCGIRMA
ncbi:MAG TPA: hypothetical protein V6C84_04640 [Coleofasciculaceae cyanobacterium]